MEQQNQQPQPPVFNQPPSPQFQPRVTASPMMDPVTAVTTCFKKYFDFKGRARRSEFWWFALFVLICTSILTFLSGIVPAVAYVSMIFGWGTFIPLCAALTRRLHDTNRSGWWVAIMALLGVGYLGSALFLLGPNIQMLANTSGDMMDLVETMVGAVQSKPGAASLMTGCSLGFMLLFIIDHIFAIFDSKWGENKYGPSPKYQ